jgi:hypothetical protein
VSKGVKNSQERRYLIHRDGAERLPRGAGLMSKTGRHPGNEEPNVEEIAQRMERVVRRFLNMPPQPHGKNPKSPPSAKPKERPTSKGRVHKAKSRS